MHFGKIGLLGLGLALTMTADAAAQGRDRGAWLTLRKQYKPGETPMVTPNGTVLPAWAARRIRDSPTPLVQPSGTGRRPWVYALSHQDVPSAYWANLSQNGFGAGPVPGFTNGPPLGNLPSAPIGPTGVLSPGASNRGSNNLIYNALRAD